MHNSEVAHSSRPAVAAHRHALTWVRIICAAAAAVLALVVLAGWALHNPAATQLGLPTVWMAPNTAVCLLLLAVAVLVPPHRSRVLVVMRVAPTLLAAMIAGVSLMERWTGAPRGIDYWLFTVDRVQAFPGRPAYATCAVVLLLAGATSVCVGGRRQRQAAQTAAVTAATIAALALLGYLFGTRSLYSIGHVSTVALHTAIGAFLLSVAVFVSVPDGVAARMTYDTDAGALLLRRIVPVTVLGMPTLAYLRQEGERAGLYDTGFGRALLTLGAIALTLAISWRTARTLAAVDARRAGADAQLRAVNADLERRVAQRAEQLLAERTKAQLLADRQRIAADLHDTVIQRLYAAGLRLQLRNGTGVDAATADEVVDSIDAAIAELRAAIHALGSLSSGDTLPSVLQDVVATAQAAAQLPVTIDVDAVTGRQVPSAIAEHAVPVVREAVSNAIRHARPTRVAVEVTHDDGQLVIAVRDDGAGLDPSAPASNGRTNMASRAAQLGGSCRWTPNTPRGTVVTWSVPIGESVPSVEAVPTAEAVGAGADR